MLSTLPTLIARLRRHRRQLLLALLLPAVTLSAVANEPAIDTSLLRQQLPDSTLLYLRLPTTHQLLTLPSGSELAAPRLGSAYVEQLQQIETGVWQQLLTADHQLHQPLLNLIASHAQSPIELLLLPPESESWLLPNLLLTTRLDLTDSAAFSALLQANSAADSGLQLLQDDGKGNATLLFQQRFPLQVQFDAQQQRLWLLAGLTLAPTQLTSRRAALQANPNHPLLTLDSEVDDQGEGLFLWLNSQALLQRYQASIPLPQQMLLAMSGFGATHQVAFGIGMRDGKSRLRLMIDTPRQSGLRALLPVVNNRLGTLTSRGEPEMVLLLHLPLRHLFQIWQGLSANNAQASAKRRQQEAQLQALIGLTPQQIANLFGPELLLFSDEVGEYVALRLHDPVAFEALLQRLGGEDSPCPACDFRYQQQLIDGQTYHHLSLNDREFGERFGLPQRRHFYWREEDGFLIFAAVPQLLFDRVRHPQSQPLADWLAQQQQSPRQALLLGSGQLEDTPRHIYYLYLRLLGALAELSGGELDLFSLPSAADLQLPDSGTFGASLELADPLIALELTSENSPLEVVFSPTALTAIAGTALAGALLLQQREGDEQSSEDTDAAAAPDVPPAAGRRDHKN